MSDQPEYYVQTAGDQSRPPLMLLHGFMGGSDDWTVDIVPTLAPDFFCLAPDLPGHGRTLPESNDEFRMERCAERVVTLLDERSISRCHLLGYSMGGRLALYLALRHPDRFDRVILESASPGLKTEKERAERIAHDKKLAERLNAESMKRFLELWYSQSLFASFDQSSERFQNLLERRLTNDPVGLSRSLKHMGIGVQPSLWDELDKITAPLLLIVGGRDAKFRAIADNMAVSCPAARVQVIENAGHNVHFEKRDEFIEQVRLFLSE